MIYPYVWSSRLNNANLRRCILQQDQLRLAVSLGTLASDN
jgi:hypothetical protein